MSTFVNGLFSISIVSHRQGRLVSALLDDIEKYCSGPLEVILVRNVPEDEGYLQRSRPFPITVLRNASRRGFGANHNQAFAASRGEFFVVSNPDIRLSSDPMPTLARAAAEARVAICGPKVVSPSGGVEDSARRFPTIATLLRRRLARSHGPDYAAAGGRISVDWVAGVFLMARREAFERLGGFDERYEMYFEDVDLCRRARLAGDEVVWVPGAEVEHTAQRASHRNVRHACWHLASALRYFAQERMRASTSTQARRSGSA